MSNTRRSRTPAAIKWLLTEHAAVLGRSIVLAQRSSLLEQKLTKVEPAYLKLMSQLNKAETELRQCEVSLAALKSSLEQLSPGVNHAAGGVVTPKLARVGKQGELQKFLIHTLQAAAPDAMSSVELTDLVIKTFKIPTYGWEVRRSVRRCITVCLRRLKKKDCVEALHAEPPEYSGIWRWKSPTSFADIAAKAERMARAAAEARNARATDSNPS